MGKTFEAISRAEEEQKRNIFQPVPYLEKPIEAYPIEKRLGEFNPIWCQELYSKIKYQTDGFKKRSIMFTSITHGNGCSTTAGYFSIFLSAKMKKKVLLMDLNFSKSGIASFFEDIKIEHSYGFYSTCLTKSFTSFDALKTNLVIIKNEGQHLKGASPWLGAEYLENFINEIYDEFDYILFDSAPITMNSYTRVLCSKADLVILILEAGKTRQRVALKVKKELELSGAKHISTILTKRKYYIPEWIYKRI